MAALHASALKLEEEFMSEEETKAAAAPKKPRAKKAATGDGAAKPAAPKPRARAKSAGPRRGGGDFKVGMREQVPAQRRPYEQFQRPHSATVIR